MLALRLEQSDATDIMPSLRPATASALFVVVLVAAGVSETPPRRDPIQLHPKNPHYFLFREKAVALIGSGEHYGAVLNADFDYRKYLATVQAAGMNYTRLFGGSYVEVPAKSFGIRRNDLAPAEGRYLPPWARSDTPGYAGGGNKFDLDRWNPEYFERYRDFMAQAEQRGVVVEVTLFSSHYDPMHWNVSALNPANNINHTNSIPWKNLQTLENGNILVFQEKYARKLVREANGFDNVIFEIQNEPWSDRPVSVGVVNPFLQPEVRDKYPNSVEAADELSLAWQAKVAEWITDEEKSLPNKHLIAQNYANFRASVDKWLPQANMVNFHYAYPDAVQLNYGLGKAIGDDETGFLGHADEPYRREAWNFMLSGGSLFDNLDYSFNVGHEDGSDTEPNGPGGGSVALRQQLRVLAEFLQGFSLVDLQPDSKTVKHAAGAIPHVLSHPGHEYAMYFDGGGPITVTLELPAGDFSGDWVNVKTGSVEQKESFQHRGGDKVLQSPAFQNGIAFRLRSR